MPANTTKKSSAKKETAKKSSAKASQAEEIMAADSVEVDKLGPKVKKIRLEMGLTQNEVAKALHVTPGFICNVENNRTAMSLRVLIYYAKLTGRTLDSIIGLVSSDYEKTALDNEITAEISKFSDEEKAKLLKTLKIWS
jgi:transcriptional regulator with XRE-family HTH domain